MPKTLKTDKSLTFLPHRRICFFSGRPSILEVALANDVGLNHSCGGMGSCTTCRVYVDVGAEKLAPRNEVESEHAQMRGYKSNERLACQTEAVEGIICRIPPENETNDGEL